MIADAAGADIEVQLPAALAVKLYPFDAVAAVWMGADAGARRQGVDVIEGAAGDFYGRAPDRGSVGAGNAKAPGLHRVPGRLSFGIQRYTVMPARRLPGLGAGAGPQTGGQERRQQC